ncbi:MAG: HAD family hydrolase [Treponema sp.]
MNVKGLGEIKAVAFDIDGTLYPQWKIHLSAVFNYACHIIFYLYYGLVRNEMHRMERVENFRVVQAEKMAAFMRCSAREAESKLNAVVYDGLKKNFEKIPCYKDVPETFMKFREAGFKLALLSDFPPEQKGEIWGIKPYCDVILGTEFLGALKPDPYPFLETAKRLGVKPEEVLYVGNSIKYDVTGSRRAGMKSAYLLTGWRKLFRSRVKGADICFSSYRQLQNIVLQ